MNLPNASSHIDVVVHPEPAEWWQIVAAFTPLAVLLGITALVLWLSVRRPASNSVAGVETRAEWWDRAEWALDMALDDKPERRKVGLAVLGQLGTDRFVGKEDAQIVAQAMAVLNRH